MRQTLRMTIARDFFMRTLLSLVIYKEFYSSASLLVVSTSQHGVNRYCLSVVVGIAFVIQKHPKDFG